MPDEPINNGEESDDLPPDHGEDTKEIPVFNPEEDIGDVTQEKREEMGDLLNDKDEDEHEGSFEFDDEANEELIQKRFEELDAMTAGELEDYMHDHGYRTSGYKEGDIRAILAADFGIDPDDISLYDLRHKRDSRVNRMENSDYEIPLLGERDHEDHEEHEAEGWEEDETESEEEDDKTEHEEEDDETEHEEHEHEVPPRVHVTPGNTPRRELDVEKSKKAGSKIAKFSKNSRLATIPTATIASTVGAVGGYASINSIAMGSLFGSGALVLGSAGSAITDGLRIGLGVINSGKIAKIQEDELTEITEYCELRQDLIDTEEEQAAAEIVYKLGLIDPKEFPLYAKQEDYAKEVYNRIRETFNGVHGNEAVTSKRLGKDLFASYQQLLGNETHDAHGAHDAHDTHGTHHETTKPVDSHGEHDDAHAKKKLAKLTPAQIKQVSVQLGRMVYAYHFHKNYVGRSAGLAGAAGLGMMTGAVAPVALALAYESGRYLVGTAFMPESHLMFDRKGEMVNTKDRKKKLALPKEDHAHDEHEEEALTKEELDEIKTDKNRAYDDLEREKKQLADAKRKVTDLNAEKTKLESRILAADAAIKRIDDEIRALPASQLPVLQEQKEKLDLEKVELEKEMQDLKKQQRGCGQKIGECQERIYELTSSIKKEIEAERKSGKKKEEIDEKIQEINERFDEEKIQIETQIKDLRKRSEGIVEEIQEQKDKVSEIANKIRIAEGRISNEMVREERMQKEKRELIREKNQEATKKMEYEDAITKLPIGAAMDERAAIQLKVTVVEKKYNTLDTKYEKEKKNAKKHKHAKPDTMWQTIKKKTSEGQIVKYFLDEGKGLAGRAVLGTALGVGGYAGMGLVPGLKYLFKFSYNGTVTSAIVGGVVTAGFYLWNRAVKPGTAPHPHTPDAHHGEKKKDDHSKDTHH